MSNYILDLVNPNDFYPVFESSPHSKVFSVPAVLNKLAYKVEWFLVKKGNQPLCLWPMCINENGYSYTPPFSYHIGPIWEPSFYSKIPYHRALSLTGSVYNLFLESFEDRYPNISASFAPDLLDIRIFDWWNFHSQQKNRIKISPRYTAIIELKEKSVLENGYRELRRREIRSFEKLQIDNFFLDQNFSLEEVINLYKNVIERSQAKFNQSTTKSISSLLNMVREGYGHSFCFRKVSDNSIQYFSLILRHQKT